MLGESCSEPTLVFRAVLLWPLGLLSGESLLLPVPAHDTIFGA